MPSRLSSLLVRDGLVGVKRMEKAFQRQVIYGGSLDTTLLEMGLVPEDRLTQYLSLTSGLPPANRAECNVFDAEAVRRCPEDVATRFRVVPLSLEAGSLRALVHDPVDMAALEELADELDVAVQPLIVPEYRWHMVFVRTYGGQASARFSTLARQAEAAPAIAPVGRARTVIVDHSDDRVVDVTPPLAPVGPEAVTMRLTALTDEQAAATPVPTPPRERSERSERRVTQVGIAMPAPAPVTITAEEPGPGEVAAPPIVGRSRTAEMATPTLQAHLAETEARRREASGRHAPVPPGSTPSDGVPTGALSTEPDPHAPLTVPRARELIAGATERDAVFMSLLRALRGKTRWAGVLTVQGGAAIGRIAIAERELDVSAMPSVLIPLDVPSPFRATITAMHPYVGPLSVGHPELDVMLARMGGTVPPAGLLLPIVLRDRTVALAVAHRGPGMMTLAEVTELLLLASVTADALGRLIARTKAIGYRAPTVDPAAPRDLVDAATVPNKKEGPRTATWTVPTAPVAPTEVSLAPAPEPVAPPTPIRGVIDRIEADDEADAAAAMVEAITRADETLPEVARRFPGRLRVDRYRVSGRALPPGQYGGLLDLAVQLGVPAGELLVERLNDPSRDVRFYAAVCLAHLRLRSAVYPLVERLFDSDYGVRACALEALAAYPARDVDLAMVRARHALHSEVLERVEAAASAIAELGDRAAIPDLIDIVGRDARRAEHARRALVTLTRIDHGTSERKWRRWWDEHREQHRLEWLIDALGGKDATLRVAAFEDLRRLTGESLGAADDVGKRDRSETRERWARWWHDFGRRRFVRDDDERLRPTAMLPVRRE
jgi:HEAT repeat protein